MLYSSECSFHSLQTVVMWPVQRLKNRFRDYMFSTKQSLKYSHDIFSLNATQGTSCLQDIYYNCFFCFLFFCFFVFFFCFVLFYRALMMKWLQRCVVPKIPHPQLMILKRYVLTKDRFLLISCSDC